MSNTLAQIAARPHESFLSYAADLATSNEAECFWVLLGFSIAGMLAHYIRLWASKQVEGSIWQWLKDNPRGAVLSLIGAATFSFGEVSAGLYQFADGEVFSWGLVILSGFKNGYGADSLVNKPTRPIWTEEHREDEEKKP
jgi:hypothetical protein